MKDMVDLMSGIHYLEMTSRPVEMPKEVKHESTMAMGWGIVGMFLACAFAIIIAI